MRRAKGSGGIEKVGKRYRARLKVFGKVRVGELRRTKAQAENDLERLLAPPPKPRSGLSLAEWIKSLLDGRFLDGPRAWKPETWETNDTIARLYLDITTPLGSLPIEAVTRADVQAFIDSLKGKSARYVRRIYAVLSLALSEAVDDGLIEASPATRIKLPQVRKGRRWTLTKDQMDALLSAEGRDEAMFAVMVMTGMRRGEACSLKWRQVGGEGIHLEDTKSPSGDRMIPLIGRARELIEAQPRRSEFVFTAESGAPVDPDNLSRAWRAFRDRAGIDPRVRLHDLRTTFITELVRRGVDVRTVQALAGHADPRTTLGVYAQASEEAKRAAVEKLSGHK